MSQAYSDPRRAANPNALPDIEIWYAEEGDPGIDDAPMEAGWYWQTCLPGCLPDSDPVGPFDTKAEALADAQEGS